MKRLRRAPSKRLNASRKHTIAKRVAQSKSRARRELKKHPFVRHRRHGVLALRLPNRVPYKADLIARAERDREEQRLERLENSQRQKAASKNELSERGELAEAEALVAKQIAHNVRSLSVSDISRRCSVIVIVSDLRDPLSGDDALQSIAQPNTVFVRVLTKADLVPNEIAMKALSYFIARGEMVTVLKPILVNTGTADLNCVGGNELHQLLVKALEMASTKAQVKPKEAPKTRARTRAQTKSQETDTQSSQSQSQSHSQAETQTFQRAQIPTVGVIGFPGVGKSSVLHTLCGNRDIGQKVGAYGHSCSHQNETVTLEDGLRLLLLHGTAQLQNDTQVALRNYKTVLRIRPNAIKFILEHSNKNAILKYYKISEFSSTKDMLRQIAIAKNCLLKGGIPNINLAAEMFIKDWHSGKIPYYVSDFVLPKKKLTKKQNEILQSNVELLSHIPSLEVSPDTDKKKMVLEDESEENEENEEIEKSSMEEESEDEVNEDISLDPNQDYDITKYF